MGGSAFTIESHGFTTSRMNKAQYIAVSNLILPLLRSRFRIAAIPPEAPGKSSYGDLDIMVVHPLQPVSGDALVNECIGILDSNCRGVIRNQPTTNIAVVIEDITVQVDVHVVPREDIWEVDYWMHSYGDMGMILSSAIKAWGLRMSSSRGLWVEIPGYSSPFILSLDVQKIVRFLELDWERYLMGFNTIEEVFEWIRGVKVNGEKIGVKAKNKLKNGRHDDRPMWVAYWKSGDQDVAYAPSDQEKKQVLEEALRYFDKEREYIDIVEQMKQDKMVKGKFNGKKVMEWTGANGKLLGLLMKSLKEDERLVPQAVVSLEDDEIESIVLEYWNRLQLV